MRLCVAYNTQKHIPLSCIKDILDKLNRYKTTRMMKDLKDTCKFFEKNGNLTRERRVGRETDFQEQPTGQNED